MAGYSGSRGGVYPDYSRVDWGKHRAHRVRGERLRRVYGMDAYSELELPGDGLRGDGGLVSAEELPEGRIVTWE